MLATRCMLFARIFKGLGSHLIKFPSSPLVVITSKRFYKKSHDNSDDDDDDNNNNNAFLPGGGLEKLQNIKEEQYFTTQNAELISKIREQGSHLKCEECLGNWAEFDKVLHASVERTAQRETCSVNKHKNCREEAYFLREQAECTKLLQDKFKCEVEENAEKNLQLENTKQPIEKTRHDDDTNVLRNSPMK